VQVVEEIYDAAQAFAWGMRRGQIAFMIHTGSRGVGQHVGTKWIDRARHRWPVGVRHPDAGIFALHGDDAAAYVAAVHTAANYAFLNRLLLLAKGLGNPDWLSSASHGAGRALRRFDVTHRDPSALGLDGVECITLRPERLVEEAPAAYKPIAPVVDIQVEAGVGARVARLRPLLTFKG